MEWILNDCIHCGKEYKGYTHGPAYCSIECQWAPEHETKLCAHEKCSECCVKCQKEYL